MYYSRNNVYQEIYKQVQLIRVYRKKGLLEEAHNTWKKALKKARLTESFALLSLLKTEFEKMVLISSADISYDELHRLYLQNIMTYADYADMVALRDMYAEIVLLKRKSHFDIDHSVHERTIALLQTINSYEKAAGSGSFWFRHYYYMSKATLLYLLNDPAAAAELLKKVHVLWQKNKKFILINGEHYLELLYMISYTGVSSGQYDFVTTVFEDEANNHIEDMVQRANFEAIRFVSYNRVYNKTAKYDQAKKLLAKIKPEYPGWAPLLNTDMNKTVTLSLGIGSFVLEQYDDALFFTKKAIDYFKEGTREEHTVISQVLLLLTVYCMDSPRLFGAQYKNAYNFFHRRQTKSPCETALIQCLNRTFYMTDRKAKLNEYRKVLAITNQYSADPVQKNIFSIFNYPGWLQSRIMRITYRQFVEQKVKAENLHPVL
jgi:tetratricopeptide (TPR) repeat protein